MRTSQDYKDPIYAKVFQNLKNYILGQFGYPLLRVQLTDEHLVMAIIDAVQEYCNHVALEFKITTVATTGNIIDIPEGVDIMHIHDVIMENDTIGLATGSAITQALRVGGVSFVVPYNSNVFSGFDIVEYMSYTQHLEDIKKITGIDKTWEIIGGKIHIYPVGAVDNKNVGILHSDIPPLKDFEQVPWIRDFATAKAKHILGTIRSRFSGMQMPGGGLAGDGEALKAEAKEEKQALMEEIRKRRAPLPWGQI